MKKIKPCYIRGTEFDNIFDAVNHLMEDEEDVFDPVIKLPNAKAVSTV